MGCKNIYACFAISLFCLLSYTLPANSQLDYRYYDYTCPHLEMIVRYNIWRAIMKETRIAASLLRLHFHDCIVDGCDGSILLDDTITFEGEKGAGPNRNSIRGFEVIDDIKADVERYCPSTVSCADILALAASQAVHLSGGPLWSVPLGRRDSRTASKKSADEQIPTPFESLQNITAKFASKGLNLNDVVVLSGGHTIGFAQCFTFKRRLSNFKGSGKPDPLLDSTMLENLKSMCPDGDGTASNSNLAPLDSVSTNNFDNAYFKNLMSSTGLLESDQALVGHTDAASMVRYYSMFPYVFSNDFARSMVKMANVGILTGLEGEIRKNCRFVN